jgi:hypothetical protein
MTCQVDSVFFADCAARSFFDQVANKWSVMILTLLNEKPTRFNELRRRLEGITHKALTQALRGLERNRKSQDATEKRPQEPDRSDGFSEAGCPKFGGAPMALAMTSAWI